jgi:hypothetical protein
MEACRSKTESIPMSNAQKDWLSKWLPLIVAVGANFITVAYGYGKLEQRVAPIEAHVAEQSHDRLAMLFVTRNEFNTRTTQRDREMEAQSAWLTRIEAKLDRVLERQARSDQ